MGMMKDPAHIRQKLEIQLNHKFESRVEQTVYYKTTETTYRPTYVYISPQKGEGDQSSTHTVGPST